MSREDDFAAAVDAMARLSENDRDFVNSVVKRLTRIDRPSMAVEPAKIVRCDSESATRIVRHFQPFSDADRNAIRDYAELYIRSTTRQRQKIYREAARTLGRTPESVKKAIRIARRQIEQEQSK